MGEGGRQESIGRRKKCMYTYEHIETSILHKCVN